jgi:hypothetical protein
MSERLRRATSAVTSEQGIPLVLHQIGSACQVQSCCQPLRRSWSYWNPGLELIFWTGSSLRAFVAEHAAEFLSLFDSLSLEVAKSHLGRYLLLAHFGGLYADLDCQCVRSVVPLLEGRQLVLSREPKEWGQTQSPLSSGSETAVGSVFLASVPGHPLWTELLAGMRHFDAAAVDNCDEVFPALAGRHLTQLVDANPAYASHIVPTSWLYPFTKGDCLRGRVFDLSFWWRRAQDAYVSHYWDGSRCPLSADLHAGVPRRAPVNVQNPVVASNRLAPPALSSGGDSGSTGSQPLISCLMVTRGRPLLAQLAIQSFLDQTYPARELVVVDDDPNPQLADWIAAHAHPSVRLVRLPDQGLPLGELRNIAVEHARGDYVCQWDDDDLYDPVRLEMQLQTLLAARSQASVLARWMIWWPLSQRLALSCYRDWEGSLLCQRSCLPLYPAQLRTGEDTGLMLELSRRVRLVRIDMPRLYLYVVHGANTFQAAHFEAHWQRATARWHGLELERLMAELQRRLPMDAYLRCD